MKIALLSTHSPGNVELARLTAQNRWDYSARHGYDLITLRMSYEESFTRGLEELCATLGRYDAVFSIGSDVVITNPAIALEPMLGPNPQRHAVLMSREIEGRSPLNNDVALWTNSDGAYRILKRIIADYPHWVGHPNLWQGFLADTPELFAQVTVLEPRAFCATDQTGEWLWEPADFLCHCLGGTTESKIERCKAVIAKL